MSSRSFRTGFTLIELLAVIATIAILASILVPVFAKARAKARSVSCLSNVKQCGIAYAMYVQDLDETSPNGRGGGREWWTQVQPYIKNIKLLYCPDRTDGSSYKQGSGVDGFSSGPFQLSHFVGYGYNGGPVGWRGGGLRGREQFIPYSSTKYLPGAALASITFPASTFAFGDTYDTPRMTVGIWFAADTWRGVVVTNNALSGAYCADPDVQVFKNPDHPESMSAPDGMKCGDIGAWVLSTFKPCTASSAPGADCIWND